MNCNPLLRVKDLTVAIEQPSHTFLAVHNLTFNVAQNQTLAIVGESGCGKTLAVLALLGLLPDRAKRVAGEIQFSGQPICLQDNHALRAVRGSGIAMIFQDPLSALNPVFRVGKQIRDVIRRHQNISPGPAKQKVLKMLAQTGLPDPEAVYRAYPHQLSGGMAQRVMIAMALSCEPKLIIADEPTTALDAITEVQILRLITDLQQQHRFALLLISHDIHVVSQLADFILVMRDARMVESGDARKLIRQPLSLYTKELIRAGMILPGTVFGEQANEISVAVV